MTNTTLIIAAIVAILAIVAVVMLRRKPADAATIEAPAAAKTASQEGHGVVDGAAAAMLDISGPVIGIDAHADLPSDDLTRIKGLGPKAAAALNSIGIHRYAQLADLDPARAGEVDKRMGTFTGRIHRDKWVEQARLLEQDDIAGFEAQFGKLG